MASVAGSKPASYATPNGPPPASFDYPNRNMRRMSTKQQNIPVEGISTSPASASEDFGAMAAALSDSTMFPDSASNSSSDGPLLAYDLASPTSRDFPMPPNSRPPSPRQFFPHPNAPPPPSPTTGSMLPAIHRPLANVANMEPSTSSHRHLSMTLARTTNANQDRTFHGQMTSDLLSAKGPVPIQFALGAFSTPPAPSQSQRYPNSNGPNVIANPNPGPNTRMVEPPAPAPIRNLNPSTPSTAKGSPMDEGSTMAPRSQTLDAPSTTKDNNRRSYTDIIAAIDTPR
ncbi:hypothetical protein DL93DRAFT_572588 [Clavulina sp. PMI_390]|nr:hypothetical protein DL93DRAFT_572588 [Clavulina sp. PMI_390]